MKEKVFMCCSDIDEVLSGSSKVAGIPVFMSMWAKTFSQYGFEVFSMSNLKEGCLDGINFIKRPQFTFLNKLHIGVISDFFIYRKIVKDIIPDIVIIHGSSRIHAFLYLLSKAFNFKLIYFGASDVDFIKGKEFLEHGLDKKLFRWALKNTNYIVCQNTFQQKQLFNDYSKGSIILPSIWLTNKRRVIRKTNDFIWVANIKPLKRLEWFVELAARMPDFKFIVIGGIQDHNYFKKIELKINELSNIMYLGPLPLMKVQEEIAKSRVLVCTSVFEGFPNTFVQAFAESVPVVSSVNPNGVISQKNLGAICDRVDKFEYACRQAVQNKDNYKRYKIAISQYFIETHTPKRALKTLLNYIGIADLTI